MKTKPKIIILETDGTNCQNELQFAFNLSGGDAKIVHINDLRTKKEKLSNFNILAFPGGFSYGDDIASGKIQAVELTTFFADELKKFTQRKDTLTIGICNGFQVLIRTGLLPFNNLGKMDATLINNDSGHLECRWIKGRVEKNSSCVFLKNMKGEIVSYPVAHGEGKLFASPENIKKIEDQKLVVFRYVDDQGEPTQQYPKNPNGSLNSIMGICDPTGRILGMMPHPERFIRREHHPNWRRAKINKPDGIPFFENIIYYVRNA